MVFVGQMRNTYKVLVGKPKAKNSLETLGRNLDDWLTVHRSITLFDLQLHAQNSYLFTYNTVLCTG